MELQASHYIYIYTVHVYIYIYVCIYIFLLNLLDFFKKNIKRINYAYFFLQPSFSDHIYHGY